MKRILSMLLILMMLLSLAGCGAASGAAETPAPETDNGTETQEQPGSDPQTDAGEPSGEDPAQGDPGNGTLVVYFSRTGEQYGVGVIEKGNTAIVAEMIAEELEADLWEILPAENRYPTTYDELTDVAKREQKDNARPAYAGEVPDLSRYGTVFIGAPVWWGDWPMILYTFFETNAEGLAGKTLIPFSTHEGSGLSGFDRKLASACPDSEVGKGLAVRGGDAQNRQSEVLETVKNWLTELGCR